MKPKYTANTMIELKQKLRVPLGLSDRRSWTETERKRLLTYYDLNADHKTGKFVATRKLAVDNLPESV